MRTLEAVLSRIDCTSWDLLANGLLTIIKVKDRPIKREQTIPKKSGSLGQVAAHVTMERFVFEKSRNNFHHELGNSEIEFAKKQWATHRKIWRFFHPSRSFS